MSGENNQVLQSFLRLFGHKVQDKCTEKVFVGSPALSPHPVRKGAPSGDLRHRLHPADRRLCLSFRRFVQMATWAGPT